jgi:hypothetical protein
MKQSLLMFCCLFLCSNVTIFAQGKFFTTFSRTDKSLPKAVEKIQNIRQFSIVQLNETNLRNYLSTAPLEFHNNGVTLPLEIPLPNGQVETFGMVESPILSPEVARLNPEIKTYAGNGTKHRQYALRLSLTSSGFNAIILNVENDAVYFEHYSNENKDFYFSYLSRDAHMPKAVRNASGGCSVGRGQNGSVVLDPNHNHTTTYNQPEVLTNTLRVYRFAIAATAEYTTAKGGVTPAYNSLIEYTNRMTAVFRRDLSVSFSLVSTTNVVHTVNGTPYTNNDSGAMLNQCQTDLDNNVGSANYDVGHVLGQSSGSGEGLAQAAACDNTAKAKGVSKDGGTPFAQVFFDQTLFHEVGHQIGMSHSFNSSLPVCTTRNQPTSVEPGAGATIMSYGFTCGTDDYFSSTTNGPILQFHTTNCSEAITYMAANVCGSTQTNANNTPVVTMPGNVTIPKSTPFTLTGSATDADGDGLTYCWEGTNTGEVAAPDNTVLDNTAKAPFFRSYEHAAGGASRTFPVLSAILNGTNQAKGDKLPSVATTANLRLTVRDNRATGPSSSVFSPLTVTVDGNSGPFLITSNLTGTLAGNSAQTITWSVNNTDQAPVSCANVKISISTDGGQTFPTTLLASTPNDGTESVTLPNTATTTARIKVEAVGNVFFDISNSDFTISTVVPVELVELKAKTVGKSAQLTWLTASEKNNAGYHIEKSVNGRTFEKIGFVKGFGTTQTPQYYSFSDNKLSQLSYYRLQQVDYDGTTTFTNVVTAEPNDKGNKFKVYPNPTTSELTVEMPSGATEAIVFDVLGRMVMQQRGEGRLTLNLRAITEGVYFVQVGGERVKFIKH